MKMNNKPDHFFADIITFFAVVIVVLAVLGACIGWGISFGRMQTTKECMDGELIHGNQIYRCEAYITYGE